MITHLYPRADAVTVGYGHMRRLYVPTIYGQDDESQNTKWIGNWAEFSAAGGGIHFNEDQTEIVLTLPEGCKFGTGFPGEVRK